MKITAEVKKKQCMIAGIIGGVFGAIFLGGLITAIVLTTGRF